MSKFNSILIVSDDDRDIAGFKNQANLLRNIDSIINSNIARALDVCKNNAPDSIIIFSYNKDKKIINLCKEIKQDYKTKNIPIVMIFDLFDEDFTLSCFDAGINDYLVKPLKESELIMRIIWALKKSENNRQLARNTDLLTELQVIDKKTETYTSKYAFKIINNEINFTQKYNYFLSIMSVYFHNATADAVIKIVKASIRNNDIIIKSADKNTINILLPKTKSDAAQAIFERLRKNLDPRMHINAGICEYNTTINAENFMLLASNTLKESISKGLDSFTIHNEPKKENSWLNKIQK